VGPLGRGYATNPDAQNLLLVGGGLGMAALIALADQAIVAGKSITLLQGARTAVKLYPTDLLPPEVEALSATDDGSAGHHGYVTDLIPQHLSWPTKSFPSAPPPWLPPSPMSSARREAASPPRP